MADVDLTVRSEVGSSTAALNNLTHALATATGTDEAAEELVARLRLERRLLRGVTKLAVAVTNDALTGKPLGRLDSGAAYSVCRTPSDGIAGREQLPQTLICCWHGIPIGPTETVQLASAAPQATGPSDWQLLECLLLRWYRVSFWHGLRVAVAL